MSKPYPSFTKEQVAAIKNKYNLVESVVTSVENKEPQHVWDVSITDVENAEVPHSIFTNGIVTHNSFSSDYFLSIARHNGVIPENMPDDEAMQKIFGLKDDKNQWIVPPRIRYYPMSIGEKFFDLMAKLERSLPDKLYKQGKWWLVYEDTKEFKKYRSQGDPDLLKKTGKIWIETDNPYPQALIAVDSYPAMMPEKQDVDDPNNALGAQARMFADNLKRVKGKMNAKRITVMGVNQLRLRPMVQFGCYFAGTKVYMADGSQHAIKDVVEQKMPGPVLAYNPSTKKMEAQRITQWFNNGPADSWLRLTWGKVRLETKDYADESIQGSIVVTPEHLIWDGRCQTLRQARQFLVGDCLTVPSDVYLTEQAKQVLIGLYLSGLLIQRKGDFIRINSLSLGQVDYTWNLDWKEKFLKAGHWYHAPDLAPLFKKKLKKSLLTKIEPLALAVFYTENSIINGVVNDKPWFILPGRSVKSVRKMRDALNRKFFASSSVWRRHQSEKTVQGIKLDKKLVSLLAPYVQPNLAVDVELSSTDLSIHQQFGQFKAWDYPNDKGSAVAEIYQIEMIENPETAIDGVSNSSRYEIEVDKLGLFVADGIVAKNSPEYEPCMVGQTPILLAGGSTMPIQEIVDNRIHAEVMAFDPLTHRVEARPIIDWKMNGEVPVSDLVTIRVQGQEITCTKTHLIFAKANIARDNRFVTNRSSWVEAGQLAPGDEVYVQLDGHEEVLLASVESVVSQDSSTLVPVYDLTVADFHTYLVGSQNVGLAVKNCGESLKFYSDTRIKLTSRSVQGGSGQIEEEEGINGGIDKYRYIHLRAHKNKLSIPNLEGWARIWISDSAGQAHGYDPVFDCHNFAKEIGILTGTKNRIKIDLPKMQGHKPLSWMNFKRLILGDKQMIAGVMKAHGIEKPFNLRKELFKLFESGKAMEMYFAKKKAEADGKGSADSEDDE